MEHQESAVSTPTRISLEDFLETVTRSVLRATDLKSTLGLAIKLFGVPGRKILETEEDANTHRDQNRAKLDVYDTLPVTDRPVSDLSSL